jgi:hypothetical protein
MEEIDGRPEQILEVRLEPCVAQRGDQGVEDIGDCACDDLALGERSGIRLVVEWTVAKELQFAQDVLGRRCAVCWLDVIMVGHRRRSFAGSAATIAAFVAITQTAGGTGQNPERQRRAAAAAEDGGGAAILLRDAKRAIAPYIM